jgi:hypothetical protein
MPVTRAAAAASSSSSTSSQDEARRRKPTTSTSGSSSSSVPSSLSPAFPFSPLGPNQFRAHADFVEKPRQLLVLGGREGRREGGREGRRKGREWWIGCWRGGRASVGRRERGRESVRESLLVCWQRMDEGFFLILTF